ncbi:MAG: transcriptional regulator, TetR family [Paenibacillaceae bacterium]|jgi:AcrR family transcriptional regulator|nr:transcriptional regulator, TetR family [Paenibacillaceae bacterium]
MENDKPARKKVKGETTKRKLFDCAGQLFGESGFDAVSVDAIVEAAGVSKGTFYVHFESKDALIIAFLTDYVGGVDEVYKAHVDALPEDAAASDKLLSLIAKIADVLTGTIGCKKMQIVYKVLLAGSVGTEMVKGYGRGLYQIFANVLEQGINRGEFKTSLSLDELTKHLVIAIRGISYEWCIRHPDFDLKEQALAHFQILLAGIRGR